jgi:hypothetical protein
VVKTIGLLGFGRSGKDCGLEYLASITTLRNAGTTSKYLAQYVADKLGLPVEEAYARRHESNEMRTIWYNYGNELREQGAATLIRMALQHGELTGGFRDKAELIAAREEGLIDLLVWVENYRVHVDPTVMFLPSDCDIIIHNGGSLDEYHNRLYRLAKFANLPMRNERSK